MKHVVLTTLTFFSCLNIFSMDFDQSKRVITTTIKKSRSNLDHVAAVTYSPDGRYFLENVSDDDSRFQLHMWDVQQNKIVKTAEDHNAGIFSTNNKYIILKLNESIFGTMTVPPLLYSIQHKTHQPLITDFENYSTNPSFELSSNNRYIKFKLYQPNSPQCECRLLEYDDKTDKLKTISLNSWGNIRDWVFDQDGRDDSNPQHMIYIKNENTLAKRMIGCDHDIVTYSIPEDGSMHVDDCLVSLQYDQFIKLLLIKNDVVQEVKTTPYPDAYRSTMSILHIPETGLIIYQSGPLSFHILNKDFQEIGRYSLENAEGYDGRIKMFLINEKKTHLVAVYDDQSTTPSKIICFDLSDINTSSTTHALSGKEIKCSMQILALKFIANKKLLAQGRKTKILDIDGKKALTLGKSQCNSCHENSIITIYHTPFSVYTAQDCMHAIPVKTKLRKYTLDKTLLDD